MKVRFEQAIGILICPRASGEAAGSGILVKHAVKLVVKPVVKLAVKLAVNLLIRGPASELNQACMDIGASHGVMDPGL